MSERTPLLDEHRNSTHSRPHDIYDRFTHAQKRLITSVISVAGIIGPFASGCFLPCVPEIAKDLNTTGAVINYTVGVYIFVIAIGNLVWAPYASFYGRQPVYLASLPLIFIGGLLSAAARNVFELVVGRSIQGFGASCVLSVGAATISDIYQLEERGTAMGIFLGTTLLGPPLAPVLGGWLATYASWRMMQLGIAIIGLLAFAFVAIFLPETSHPGTRGIDKYMVESLAKSLSVPHNRTHWRFVSLNPFRILLLLKSPVLVFVSLSGSFGVMAYFVVMVPLSYTLGPRYGMDTPALIGACFIPSGLGNIAGAVVSGRLADIAIIRGRNRRQGKWNPEDRLLAAMPGALFLVPCALIVFAISVTFISGKIGLTICLICLFINGMGVDMIIAPSSTYLVDLFRSQGAESPTESYVYDSATRNTFGALACAVALPMVYQVGVIGVNAITVVLALLASMLFHVTIQNGEKLRSWVDMDYTTVEDE
ncbi:major facilitator superfamily domain-containing protein [Hysterangium stoloniferum]|nr:major facilitator superfamily domain-containing protein [Hysterangium stoloniferum]